MKSLPRFSLLFVAVSVCSVDAGAVTGKIQSVVLYRGQALVTRQVPLDAPEGLVELVVGELPRHVLGDSLFAEAGEGMEVRAVRLRTRAVGEEPQEAVRKLDEQLQAVADRAERAKRAQELVAKRIQFLDKLEGFTAPTAKAELSKGVLNFEALEALATFSFKQRQEAAEESLKLAAELRQIEKEADLLRRRRQELTADSSRTAREALVFLEKRAPGAAQVKLSYLVDHAGWSPSYNVRAANDGKSVDVEYNALIQQTSGEDWSRVRLTLSTASPGLSAQGPGLAPFRVALSKTAQQQGIDQRQVAQQFQMSQNRLQQAEQGQRRALGLRDNRDFNWKMNTAANEAQNLELVLAKDALQTLVAEPGSADVTSVTYTIANAVSIASRQDQQMLRIADVDLPSRFYHVATPILTSYVYREAELTNQSIEAILGGPVNVYLDGRFVGRGTIPTVARGETVVVGFGADPQLRARRELVEKRDTVQGGNREITVRYRLVLENYKEKAVEIRLMDRYPISEREADIRVTLGEMEAKLSEDPLYERIEKPKGILRWDARVPARAMGKDAQLIQYGYTLEFQRDLTIGTPVRAKVEELREEFERMQFKRALR